MNWKRSSLVGLAATSMVLLLSGCGGSDSSNSPPDAAASGPPTSTAATRGTGGTDSAAQSQAQIKQAYVEFFSGKTDAKTKIGLVEHGEEFADVINQQAGGPLASGTSATVSQVSVDSPTSGTVTFTVDLGGTPALKDQTGQAVQEDGTWKVSATTFCGLLTLEGAAPAVCAAS